MIWGVFPLFLETPISENQKSLVSPCPFGPASWHQEMNAAGVGGAGSEMDEMRQELANVAQVGWDGGFCPTKPTPSKQLKKT